MVVATSLLGFITKAFSAFSRIDRPHVAWTSVTVAIFVLLTCAYVNPTPASAVAGINRQINFQGRLLNSQGATVPDGFYNMQFKIYQDGTGTAVGNPGGTLMWTESHLNANSQGVTVKNGFLSVQLGSINAFGSQVDWNQDTIWLSMNIGNTNATCTPFSNCAPDGEMVPMKRMTATPYALNSGLLNGLASSNFVQLAQGVQTDASTASSIFINKTASGNLLQLQNGGTDAFTVTNAGDLTFGANANHTLSIATAGAGTAGKTLTMAAGAGGSGAGSAGGDLVLAGGAAGGTDGNGGNVTINAGAKTGTGTDGTLSLGTANTSVITLGQNTTLAAGKSLTLVGGASATRPSSPTEGMVYYDTDTDKLLVYSNGKWQADRRDVTKTVAPSNAAQEIKDSADYVATGTSDQTVINAALTAAGGGRVYLFEGTFTTDDAISVPNNTVLAGSGAGTLIQFANIAGQTKNMITNTDTTTGTGVTVRDLKLDGNDGVNTTGTMTGIFFNGLGGYGTERRGALIQGVTAQNFLTQGIRLENSVQSILTGSTVNNNNGSGMFLQSSSHNTITGNTASGNGVNGIALNASSNNTVTANTTSNNTQSGLSVASSSNHNAIDGNTSYANGGIGISLTTSSSHNTVSTNTSNSNSSNGISLNTAHNNSLVGNTSSNNTLNGIGLTSANQNTLTGDTTSGNGTNGISLSGSSRNTITGSSISSNLAGGTQLVSTSDDNVLSSGVLYDNGGSGAVSSITVTSSSNNQIIGNRITDTAGTAYAINISNAGASTNYLADNTYSGTGATTINDAGTGTIFAGQIKDSSNGNYYVQPAGTVELMKNTNITGTLNITSNVDTNGSLTVGNANQFVVSNLGVVTAGAWQGTAINDTYVADTLTVDSSSTVDWQALNNYPSACAAGSAVTQIGDSVTCSSFVSGTAASYIQNGTGVQASANLYIRSAAASSVTAVLEGASGQTADLLQFNTYDGSSSTTVASFTAAGNLKVASSVDRQTSGALTLGGSNTNTLNLSTAGSTKLSVTSTGVLQFAQGANRTLNVATTASNAAGFNLTIAAGAAGSGASAFGGGTLNLQGGAAAGTGDANGGNLSLSGGTGVGTGANGLVILTTTTMQTTNDGNCYLVASSCTVTSSSLNNNSAILVGFTADGQTATLPAPPQATAGRLVYITAANTSKDFTLSVNGGGTGNLIAMRQNTTATMIWNGTAWTAAGASSSTTLQSAYDNTLQSAGGAELVVSKTAATNGLTIRDSASNPVNGAVLSVQSSSAAGLLSVNSNLTEYASNAGAETAGSGGISTFPSSTWEKQGNASVSVTRNTTTSNNSIATGQASVSATTTANADDGIKNTLTQLTPNQTYNVSFTTILSSGTFTDMAVHYSRDGTTTSLTTCKTGQAIATRVWTKVNCTFTAPASGITASNAIFIRQATATVRTFYVDNLSVTLAADHSYATDGSVDDGTNFATNWPAISSATVTRDTSVGNDASSSAKVVANTAGQGVKDKLSVSPIKNKLYRVTVYLYATASFSTFKVQYHDGNTATDCDDYNSTVASTDPAEFKKITCYVKTPNVDPTGTQYVHFTQTDSVAHTWHVDTFSMTLAENTTPNVQIGGGINGGPTTLFTLDKGASAPIAGDNDALLGSMYYDTTLGKLQCYEADGWGACGSSPDVVVTISPEYTNAVMHGTGIGTMTSDFCSSASGININDGTSGQPTICGSNETKNFYKWTSPQSTNQAYSIYVTYQLPSTFKAFASGQTSLAGRVSDTSTSSIEYRVYRSNPSSGLTACGNTISVTTSANTWQTPAATGTADPSTCGFAPGDSIVFKITMSARSNANAYVGNLNFTFSNR